MWASAVSGCALADGTHTSQTKQLEPRRAGAPNLAANANVNNLPNERPRFGDAGRCRPTLNLNVGHSG